tara:strand:+ start:1031 stop:1567 length:537 start_codon:yes stop_codon:yes gene_type:complete
VNAQTIFLIVNLIGGAAVLGSYAFGLGYFPEYRNELWGGIYGIWRNVLVTSMLLSGAAYLTFCYFIIFRADIDAYGIHFILGPQTITLLTALFLLSATLWMPSAILYMHTENNIWWIFTVGALWITALSLLSLTGMYAFSANGSIPVFDRIICTVSLSIITLHCLVIDAIIWVWAFHK